MTNEEWNKSHFRVLPTMQEAFAAGAAGRDAECK